MLIVGKEKIINMDNVTNIYILDRIYPGEPCIIIRFYLNTAEPIGFNYTDLDFECKEMRDIVFTEIPNAYASGLKVYNFNAE